MKQIQYNKKELQIQIIGHFDGYICGLLTSLRHFEILPYWFGRYDDGTITTIYQCKDLKEFEFYSKKIKQKIKEYKKIM